MLSANFSSVASTSQGCLLPPKKLTEISQKKILQTNKLFSFTHPTNNAVMGSIIEIEVDVRLTNISQEHECMLLKVARSSN